MIALVKDLDYLKGGTEYVTAHTRWVQEGSSHLLLPIQDFSGMAMFFHAYPDREGYSGTLRLRNFERMRQELESERPGEEYHNEDKWLNMHGHTPTIDSLKYLFNTTAKLFNDEIFVNQLILHKEGVKIDAGTPSYKSFRQLADICDRLNEKDIRVENMHTDKRGMINEYASSLR